jgi:transposase
MWKPEHRQAAERRGLRYPSDLTDAEWALVKPMIPPAKRGGRKRTVDVREVLNGIFYVLSTGCQWNALPTDLPPKSTIYDYLDLWDWDGTLERIDEALYLAVREQAGREASPTVAIIDAQSAKGAQKGGVARSVQDLPLLQCKPPPGWQGLVGEVKIDAADPRGDGRRNDRGVCEAGHLRPRRFQPPYRLAQRGEFQFRYNSRENADICGQRSLAARNIAALECHFIRPNSNTRCSADAPSLSHVR